MVWIGLVVEFFFFFASDGDCIVRRSHGQAQAGFSTQLGRNRPAVSVKWVGISFTNSLVSRSGLFLRKQVKVDKKGPLAFK